MSALKNIERAISLLNEIDSTPHGQVDAKLDRIASALIAAKYALDPSNVVQIGDHDAEYLNTLDTVASIVGAPQFDGAAS